jgi:hypothetical protein
MKWCSLFLFVLVIWGCKKENRDYTVSGRLLQSSSNPVPVANLVLELYQAGGGSNPLGGTSSSSAKTKTDAQGNFSILYKPGRVFFAGIISKNSGQLSLNAQGSTAPGGEGFFWYNLPALKDTALGTVFLYKKINRFIVKVRSINGLQPSDSLEIYAATEAGLHRRFITGLTIAAGMETAVDTISHLTAGRVDAASSSYYANFYIRKSGGAYYNTNVLPPLDEEERTVTVLMD